MEIYLAQQTAAFLQACLLGAGLALLFDCFRISRIAFKTPSGIVFLEDVAFFLVCAFVTFAFMLSSVDGKVRYFILAGEILGGVVYRMTLGYLIMKVSKGIIRVLKAVFGFLFRYICLPLFRVCYFFTRILLIPFHILFFFTKKIWQKCKFRLKVGRVLLYNQVVTGSVDSRKKKRRVGQNVLHEQAK